MRRKHVCRIAVSIGLLVIAFTTSTAISAEVVEILRGLNNPCGLAVHTGTGHVFVSSSGDGQILRVDTEDLQATQAVVSGFPKDVYGKGPMYDIGPLGLVLIDNGKTLVVGGGGHVDGQEIMRAYTLPDGDKTLTADEMAWSAGPIGPSDDSPMGEGNFYDLAASDSTIWITSNGNDVKGWVLKIELAGPDAKKLIPFIATKEATTVDAPVGIELGPRGEVVVGQMGEITVPNDSLLTFYDPQTGEMIRNIETGLFDIAALAYSPKSGKLYALDFAWMDTSQGGLFRLDIGDDGNVEAVKIAALDKPTAMAFSDDGSLYVTVIGTASDNEDRPGQLLKITGDL